MWLHNVGCVLRYLGHEGVKLKIQSIIQINTTGYIWFLNLTETHLVDDFLILSKIIISTSLSTFIISYDMNLFFYFITSVLYVRRKKRYSLYLNTETLFKTSPVKSRRCDIMSCHQDPVWSCPSVHPVHYWFGL